MAAAADDWSGAERAVGTASGGGDGGPRRRCDGKVAEQAVWRAASRGWQQARRRRWRRLGEAAVMAAPATGVGRGGGDGSLGRRRSDGLAGAWIGPPGPAVVVGGGCHVARRDWRWRTCPAPGGRVRRSSEKGVV